MIEEIIKGINVVQFFFIFLISFPTLLVLVLGILAARARRNPQIFYGSLMILGTEIAFKLLAALNIYSFVYRNWSEGTASMIFSVNNFVMELIAAVGLMMILVAAFEVVNPYAVKQSGLSGPWA